MNYVALIRFASWSFLGAPLVLYALLQRVEGGVVDDSALLAEMRSTYLPEDGEVAHILNHLFFSTSSNSTVTATATLSRVVIL